MKWFTSKTESFEQALANEIVVPVTFRMDKTGATISLSFKDYLYSHLKEELAKIVHIVKEHKIKTVTVELALPTGEKLFFNPNKDNPEAVVGLLEAVKARVPSATKITVSLREISFALNDFTMTPKTVAELGVMLSDHFNEDVFEPIKITVTINNAVKLAYEFKWVKSQSITETIVNSNRYAPLIEFLLKTPHPEVQLFSFEFRDVSKGLFATMELEFKRKLPPQEEYEISEFIRKRISDEYRHLGVY